MKQLWVDTETGGLDAENCALLQLAGFVLVDGVFQEYFNIRIRQDLGKIVEPKSLETHHLDPTVGVSILEAYRQFIFLLDRYINKYDSDDKLHICGYNARFDVDFLRQFFLDNHNRFYASYFWHPPIDVMSLAGEKLAPVRHKLKNFKLTTVCEFMGIPLDSAHEALADILATHQLYEKLREI